MVKTTLFKQDMVSVGNSQTIRFYEMYCKQATVGQYWTRIEPILVSKLAA